MRILIIRIMFCFYAPIAWAQTPTFTAVPYVFQPNTTVVPNQLMSDFLHIIANGNAVASNLNSKITAISSVPTGAIVFFNLGSCPSGWTLISADNGKFVRDLDSSAGRDTTGTLLGAFETGGMQDHKHNLGNIASGFTLPVQINNGGAQGTESSPFNQGSVSPTGLPSTGNHGSEVRPSNVSLLLCSKN